MTDKDNIIKFPTKRADDIMEQLRLSLIAKGKTMFNDIPRKTYIQSKIDHIQGQLGCIWLSIPNEGTNIENPDEWEPWMLGNIVETLKELDTFLIEWYRDEDRY